LLSYYRIKKTKIEKSYANIIMQVYWHNGKPKKSSLAKNHLITANSSKFMMVDATMV